MNDATTQIDFRFFTNNALIWISHFEWKFYSNILLYNRILLLLSAINVPKILP